jgi:hypothetical protein
MTKGMDGDAFLGLKRFQHASQGALIGVFAFSGEFLVWCLTCLALCIDSDRF